MLDITRWLGPIALWILLAFFALIFLKHHYIGFKIAQIIEHAPLDVDQIVEQLEIREIDENGFKLKLKTSISNTKLPFKSLKVRVKIPNIKVYHQHHLIAIAGLSDELVLDGISDLVVDQIIDVDLCQTVKHLKPLIHRIAMIGSSELDRVELFIKFKLSIDVHSFCLDDIDCFKAIRLGDLKPPKDPKAFDKLIPNVRVLPSVKPTLRSIKAGLELNFDVSPGLKFNIDSVKFRLLLNDSSLADCIITNLKLKDSTSVISIDVFPLAMGHKPITGSLTTAKGMLKGAINGLANGVLYGDWGGQSMVMGIRNIDVQLGVKVWWIDEILHGIEVEHDLDAVRKVRQKLGGHLRQTNGISEGILQVVYGILDATGFGTL